MNILSHIHVSELCTAALQLGADAGVKSFILFCVAGVAVFVLRRASAATRHLILFSVLVGALALPILSVALPRWTVWTFNTPEPAHKPTAASHGPDVFVGETRPYIKNVFKAFPPTAITNLLISTTPIEHKSSSPQTSEILVLLWICGFVISLVPLGGGVLSLFRLRRGSTLLSSGRVHQVMQAAASAMAYKGSVLLCESSNRTIPMTWGFFRPIIIVPKEAGDWSEERLRMVFLHEFAHLKRRDFLRKVIGHITGALYWFNPLAWLCSRGMLAEMEKACDDAVLRHGMRPADYADELLRIAIHDSKPAYGLQAIAVVHPSTLGNRVIWLLRTDLNRNATGSGQRGLLFGVLLSMILPLAMLHGQPKSGEGAHRVTERPSTDDLQKIARVSQALVSLEQKQKDFARAEQLFITDKVLTRTKYEEAKRALEMVKAELRNDTEAQLSLVLEGAKQDLDRAKELYRQNILPKARLEEAQARYEIARLRATGDLSGLRAAETRLSLVRAESELRRATDLYNDRILTEAELNRTRLTVQLLKEELGVYASGDAFDIKIYEVRRVIEQASDFFKRNLVSAAEYKAIYSTLMPTLSESASSKSGTRGQRQGMESLRAKLRHAEARLELLSIGWKQGVVERDDYLAAHREVENLRKRMRP
jgi:beta-lactamase regulating signal transducer with metallopeptidase domain